MSSQEKKMGERYRPKFESAKHVCKKEVAGLSRIERIEMKWNLGMFIALLTVLLVGCSPAESIYNNVLLDNVVVDKVELKLEGKITNYYVTMTRNKVQENYKIRNGTDGIYQEMLNYIKSSKFNGVEPRFDFIVDEEAKEIKGIALVKSKK
ncbi:hypothetical protein ACFVS2_20825 [Brevibacillus sp. NPDC058079]|uniref:hypothetical protein n=1 Tax=Brevibacillus sp. NPDC058079 TaxID=3346330 RepID=UPI0036F03F48